MNFYYAQDKIESFHASGYAFTPSWYYCITVCPGKTTNSQSEHQKLSFLRSDWRFHRIVGTTCSNHETPSLTGCPVQATLACCPSYKKENQFKAESKRHTSITR
ncbi:hypothetical protein GHT06_014133 [Daphnia sinensis]|uniref:Uncharacterized protein n=1 Tax=Daphnia sinensis TaxID=1820382 RepID=A0AAD5LDB6_9CRUS|nr:hypothetical protein GHT06_014133 [Daphnia sinensis]